MKIQRRGLGYKKFFVLAAFVVLFFILAIDGVRAGKFIAPELQVNIPGFEGFTKEEEKLKICSKCGDEDYILADCPPEFCASWVYEIPWIGEYFVALYKWSVGAIAVLAVIMIMIGGIQWLIAGDSAQRIGEAKKRITYAVSGLVLVLLIYQILVLIDRRLVIIPPIRLGIIEKAEFTHLEEDASTTDLSCLDIKAAGRNVMSIDNVVFVSKYSTPFLKTETADKLEIAAQKLKTQNIVLQVNNAFRSHEQQQYLYDKRGKNPGCAPKINQCNCPHMKGVGVDVVCQGKPHWDPCQKKVIEAMFAAGFCRLSGESWHFEYPKISSTCVYK